MDGNVNKCYQINFTSKNGTCIASVTLDIHTQINVCMSICEICVNLVSAQMLSFAKMSHRY